MTFELFVFKAQTFAAKLQASKPGPFFSMLKIAFGSMITQTLMGICFARTYEEGAKQWRKQQLKSANNATKKSVQPKQRAQSVK